MGGGTLCATGPYNVENLLIDGYDVVVNKQKVQAYRAPGQPQGAFAVEPIIDELAEALGMDPIDLRIKNVAKEGDRMPNGVAHPRFGVREMEEAMKDHPHYSDPLGEPSHSSALRGRGSAVGYRWQAGQMSAATIIVNNNGTINLVTGSVDIGGTRTAVAMQAAEVLGIAAEDVIPTVVDTDTIGYTAVTGGSRTAFDTGLAAIQAAEDVKRQMAARGRRHLGSAGRRRDLRGRRVQLPSQPGGPLHLQGTGRAHDAHRRGNYHVGLGGIHRRRPHHRGQHLRR